MLPRVGSSRRPGTVHAFRQARHGLGLEEHEPPYIVVGNSMARRPGMTFTVEPGIYLEGIGGVRIEDDVAVTDDGMITRSTFAPAYHLL